MDLKKAPPAFKKAFAEKIAEGKGDAARWIISGYVAGDGMIPKEKYAEIYKKILEI
jgi:hypothetical protein